MRLPLLIALAAGDGTLLWSFAAGDQRLSEPVVDGLTAFGKFLHKKMTAPRAPRPAQKRQPGPRVVRRAKAEPVPGQS